MKVLCGIYMKLIHVLYIVELQRFKTTRFSLDHKGV